MKLHVGACGIGYGHVGRDLPTATALRKEGWRVYFTTYGEAVNFALSFGFPVYEEPAVGYVTKKGEVTMKGTILSFPWQLDAFFKQLVQEYKIIKAEKPDVVLSDSRLSTVLAAKLARKKTVLLIHELRVLTPIRNPSFKGFADALAYRFLSSFWSLADRVVVSDFPPKLTIAEDNVRLWWPLRRRGKTVYSGPCGRVKGFKGDRGGVVYMRVSGLQSERDVLKRVYLEAGLLLAKQGIKVVVSNGDVLDKTVRSYEGGNLKVYGWIDDVAALRVALLVSVAGQTSMSEFVDAGIPFILTPPRSHTEHWGIAQSLARKGIAVVLPLGSLTGGELADAVKSALANDGLYRAAASYAEAAQKYPGDPVLMDSVKRLTPGSSR